MQYLVPVPWSVADMYPVADLEFRIPVLEDELVEGQVQSSDEVTQPRVVVAVSGGDVRGLSQTVLAAAHASHEFVQPPAAVRAVDVDWCFPHPSQWLQHVVAERLQVPHHLFRGDVCHEGEPLTPCQFLHREVRRIKFMYFHAFNFLISYSNSQFPNFTLYFIFDKNIKNTSAEVCIVRLRRPLLCVAVRVRLKASFRVHDQHRIGFCAALESSPQLRQKQRTSS